MIPSRTIRTGLRNIQKGTHTHKVIPTESNEISHGASSLPLRCMTSAAGVERYGTPGTLDEWQPLRFFLQGAPFEHASPRLVQDAASAIQA